MAGKMENGNIVKEARKAAGLLQYLFDPFVSNVKMLIKNARDNVVLRKSTSPAVN